MQEIVQVEWAILGASSMGVAVVGSTAIAGRLDNQTGAIITTGDLCGLVTGAGLGLASSLVFSYVEKDAVFRAYSSVCNQVYQSPMLGDNVRPIAAVVIPPLVLFGTAALIKKNGQNNCF